jgi:hypothetical protein
MRQFEVLVTSRAAWISSFSRVSTPRPRLAGSAATRTPFRRLIAASVDRPEAGRCEPINTTGKGTLSTRLRKYAVSSSVAVPWPITMPARSGCSFASLTQMPANSCHSAK